MKEPPRLQITFLAGVLYRPYIAVHGRCLTSFYHQAIWLVNEKSMFHGAILITSCKLRLECTPTGRYGLNITRPDIYNVERRHYDHTLSCTNIH